MTIEREKFYIELIKSSHSLNEVCKKANIVSTTGNYDTLKNLIITKNIDISHFKRNGGGNGKTVDLELYLTNQIPISSFKLKNKLFKYKLKEPKCECCGITEWMGKPLKFELHHIDGNHLNNNINNLAILCPNCHCFTENYGGKNQKLNKSEKREFDIVNNIDVVEINTEHQDTGKKINTKKYNGYKLIDEIKSRGSITKVALQYSVSEAAIRRWLKKNSFPYKIKDIMNA